MPESGTGEGSEFKARAGALMLLYIASPMERRLLRALVAEAATGVQLLDMNDLPDPDDPVDLSILTDPYLVEPADPNADPNEPIGPDTILKPTAAGREVPFVGMVLQRWLNSCPHGSLELGPEGGPALLALVRGWASAVMHALAGRPLTLAEVTEVVGILDEDGVEERVAEMEDAGLLEAFIDDEDEERFAVTNWLRMAIAPLAAAARVEHRHPPGDTAPIAALDVEASFLLALPLLELPREFSGSCSLAVELDQGVSPSPAGVTVRVEAGRVVSCETGLDEGADAWAAGSAADWLDTVIEPDVKSVRCGGERRLTRTLLHALHQALFGVPVG
jgi:hypothetical protein